MEYGQQTRTDPRLEALLALEDVVGSLLRAEERSPNLRSALMACKDLRLDAAIGRALGVIPPERYLQMCARHGVKPMEDIRNIALATPPSPDRDSQGYR